LSSLSWSSVTCPVSLSTARSKSQPPKVVAFINLLFINTLQYPQKVKYWWLRLPASRQTPANWHWQARRVGRFAIDSFHESATGRVEYRRVRPLLGSRNYRRHQDGGCPGLLC